MNMPFSAKRLFATAMVSVVALAIAWGLAGPGDEAEAGRTRITLQQPTFLASVHADGSSPASFLEDEAGISAYFKANVPINIADVRDLFETIETETDDYIIGSIRVRNYTEYNAVHAYIHKDGWVLVYYWNSNPAGKMIDIRDYNTTGNITTKFEKVLAIIAGEVGSSFPGAKYYDFMYPNATHMIMAGERQGTFYLELPSSYGYYERSYSIFDFDWYGATVVLNGVTVGSVCKGCDGWGTITSAQMLPDMRHSITMSDIGVVVILYRVP